MKRFTLTGRQGKRVTASWPSRAAACRWGAKFFYERIGEGSGPLRAIPRHYHIEAIAALCRPSGSSRP